jgi:carboxymethylenebutenolidase
MTGHEIAIEAADGHRLAAWVAEPEGRPSGGVVVAQEMYGVNGYIRTTCELFADRGFLAIAPALYDRVERGLTFEYTEADNARAKALYRNYDWSKALLDLEAARDTVARAGRVGVVGFCFGGSLAWLAACRSRFACAVSYYGGEIDRYLDEEARCPVLGHVGDRDDSLTPEKLARFRERHPEVPFRVYPGARHGFDNDRRAPRHHPEATQLARRRTLAFLRRHLVGKPVNPLRT